MALVTPRLEYALVIWVHIDAIESVQRYLVLFALRVLGRDSDRIFSPYEHRIKLTDLFT